MNFSLGCTNAPDYGAELVTKLTALKQPTRRWVFVDEHPDSINDGYFLNKGDDLAWFDLPASYHNGAASFSFADGHSQMHAWKYPVTKPPSQPDAALPLPKTVSGDQSIDLDWVLERMSVER